MASTSPISFTLPRFTTISTNLSPPKPSPLFFPLNLKRSRVSVTAKVNDDDSPSQLMQLHGDNDVISDNETLVSYNKLPRILKPLTSIMLYGSLDGHGQITKRVEERRLELVNEYLSYNIGLVFRYKNLARVLKDWYFNVKEQEEDADADAVVEVGMWRLVKVGSLAKNIVSWLHGVHFLSLEFENVMLLCFAGVALSIVGVFLLTSILILMLLTPSPPPPSAPPSCIPKWLPFIDFPMDPSNVVKDWMEIGVNVVKDMLPLDKVRLVMLATQMKIFIPIMMMVAAVR